MLCSLHVFMKLPRLVPDHIGTKMRLSGFRVLQRTPPFVIPAKAGIQGRWRGGTNHTQTLPTTRSHFHTLVCRHQPAWAIGTKACPGLLSGIETSCHRIRHSRAGGNPRKGCVAELRESIKDLRTRQSTESKVLPPLPRRETIELRVTPAGLVLVSSQGHTGNPPHTTCRVPSREFPSLTPSFPRRRESKGGGSGANDSQTLLKTKRHLHALLCRQRTTRTIPTSIDGQHLKRGDPPPLPRWERIEVRVNPVALGLGPSQRAHSLYRVAGIRLR